MESVVLSAGLVRSFLNSTFAEVMNSEDFVDWLICRGWRHPLDAVLDPAIQLLVGTVEEA